MKHNKFVLPGWMLGILLFVSLVLTACGQKETVEEVQESSALVEMTAEESSQILEEEPEPVVYSISLTLEDEHWTETVEEGQMLPAEAATVDLADGSQIFWMDENGNSVDPFTQVIVADASFMGYKGAALLRGVPYLALDENEFFHPATVLSLGEVQTILEELLIGEEYPSLEAAKLEAMLMEIIEKEEAENAQNAQNTLTEEQIEAARDKRKEALLQEAVSLKEVLELVKDCFPEAILSKAEEAVLSLYTLEETSTENESAGEAAEEITAETLIMTKVSLAQLIYTLSYPTPVSFCFEDEPVIAKDLDLLSMEADAVLTATVPYTLMNFAAQEEMTIPSLAILEARWTPGPHLYKGHLYYADENGAVIRNGHVGYTLNFLENGRYSSGSEELDIVVADLLFGFLERKPEKTFDDLLDSSFFYVRDKVIYAWKEDPAYGDNDGDWVIDFALGALTGNRYGDCYGFSSAFGSLARGLGYDAHVMSGTWYGHPKNPHSWVFINLDGEDFVFDAQMANRQLLGMRSNYGYSMFKLPQNAWHYWSYEWEDNYPMVTIGDVEVADSTTENAENDGTTVNPDNTGNDNTDTSANTEEGAMTAEEVVALAKTMLRQNVQDLTEIIGEPDQMEYSSSCMGDGQDGKWTYQGFVIYTYKEGETEIIQYAEVTE